MTCKILLLFLGDKLRRLDGHHVLHTGRSQLLGLHILRASHSRKSNISNGSNPSTPTIVGTFVPLPQTPEVDKALTVSVPGESVCWSLYTLTGRNSLLLLCRLLGMVLSVSHNPTPRS